MVRITHLIAWMLICSFSMHACEHRKVTTSASTKTEKKTYNLDDYPAEGYWPGWDWENPETVREEQEILDRIAHKQKTPALFAELRKCFPLQLKAQLIIEASHLEKQ